MSSLALVQRRLAIRLSALRWDMLVFALVDTSTLRWMGGEVLALSPSAVYSLAFLIFWGVIAASGLLTRLLEGDPEHINREGASGAFRH